MFDTMRGSLKGEIESDSISIKVKGKLHSFLEQNPDVDQYLSDTAYNRLKSKLYFGLFIGFIIAMFLFAFFGLLTMSWWHDLGYLHIPGMIGWS